MGKKSGGGGFARKLEDQAAQQYMSPEQTRGRQFAQFNQGGQPQQSQQAPPQQRQGGMSSPWAGQGGGGSPKQQGKGGQGMSNKRMQQPQQPQQQEYGQSTSGGADPWWKNSPHIDTQERTPWWQGQKKQTNEPQMDANWYGRGEGSRYDISRNSTKYGLDKYGQQKDHSQNAGLQAGLRRAGYKGEEFMNKSALGGAAGNMRGKMHGIGRGARKKGKSLSAGKKIGKALGF